MKILLLASECPPVPGGIAAYVNNTTTMFAQAGHDVTVIARAEEAGREKQGNIEWVKLETNDHQRFSRSSASPLSENHPSFPYNVMGLWGAMSYQFAQRVIEWIQEQGKPDVIECEDYSGLAYFLLQYKLLGTPELQDVPIILTLHSCQYLLYPVNEMPTYQLSNYWVGRMEKFCLLAADGRVAPTQFIASQVGQTLDPNLNIEIIPLPATTTLLETPIKTTPISKDIVYFGRLEVRKGVIPLVDACARLWDKGQDFTLTLIGGNTWYYKEGCHVKTYLQEKYSPYIKQGSLRFHPPISPPQLYERIAQAWCVVLPSLWENFPNTCLEAMLLGKVVLVTEGVGHEEMLQEAGFIFHWDRVGDFEEKLEKILALSVVENEQVGKQARDRILSLCNPKNILQQRLNHIQHLLDHPKHHHIFPSLNYPPHGKINLPSVNSLTENNRLLSVCIPYYNHAPYIRETLDSVIASDYPNLEILLLNDGSTDPDSITLLEKLPQQYPQVKILHTENKGLATARNTLVKHAQGEYIAFLDSDDRVSPTFYTEAVQILRKYPNIGFVASWIKEFGDSQKVWVAWTTEFPYLLGHNSIGVCTVLRKSMYCAIGGTKPAMDKGLEDYECWVNACSQGWVGVVIPKLHYFYRVRSDSMLRSLDRDSFLYLYEKIAHFHPQLYQQYGTELFNLLNQNSSSWLWDNPSLNVGEYNTDLTGIQILNLLFNKIKRVYGDGGLNLIQKRLKRLVKSLLIK